MKAFEIGLVGAGAISAGAYTAGVVDFFVEALDEWYALKEKEKDLPVVDKTVPPHDVKLSVFSGASAGGVTAAIAAGFLGSKQPPIHNEQEAAARHGEDKLFDSWVEQLDITQLLEVADLKKDDSKPLASLLDSSVFPGIADAAFNATRLPTGRLYVAEDFKLFLTLTNLRGVPYSFPIQGNIPMNYGMSLHADYFEFTVSATQKPTPVDLVTWNDLLNSASPNLVKRDLKAAMLATGAFPIGLAPRNLEHTFYLPPPDLYSARNWPYSNDNPPPCVNAKPIPAAWGTLPNGYRYRFTCVDGGVMNNEPLELARIYLAGGVDKRNEREGTKADKAVILIDPFPNDTDFDPEFVPSESPDMMKSVLGMFSALVNQARFKPDELMLADGEDVYSRFLIAPSRDGMKYPIACGVLGGFGGFLQRSFRAHDYFLGRRNAQNFLRNHFVLPQGNPLFDKIFWTDKMIQQYAAVDSAGAEQKYSDPVSHKPTDQTLLPIIPVVGKAATDCQLAPWPRYTDQDFDLLKPKIRIRLDAVMDRLVVQYTGGGFWKLLANTYYFFSGKKGEIVDMIVDKIKLELHQWNQLY